MQLFTPNKSNLVKIQLLLTKQTSGGVILTREKYEELTLVELKNKAKELGIKNISKYKKGELIDEIIKATPNTIEKNGVVLTERISPKIKEESISAPVQTRDRYNQTEEEREQKRERLKVMINESGSSKGVLEVQESNSFGFLRCDNYQTGENDI